MSYLYVKDKPKEQINMAKIFYGGRNSKIRTWECYPCLQEGKSYSFLVAEERVEATS